MTETPKIFIPDLEKHSLFSPEHSNNVDKGMQIIREDDYNNNEYHQLTAEEQQVFNVLNKQQVNMNEPEDSEMTIYLLQKPVKNPIEYQFLQKAIRGLSVFQKNPELINSEKLTSKILSNLKHKHYSKHETIFEMDEVGYEYFIVLKGKVECLIKKNKDEQTPKSNLIGNGSFTNEFYHKQYPNLYSVKTFTPGEAFGEIALLANCKRTATMVCSSDVDVMTLSKEVFSKVMGEYTNNVLNEKVQFLKNFNFFKTVPTFQMLQLLHYMKTVTFKKNNIIFKENDAVKYIYFIREGEVELSQLIQLEQLEKQNQFAIQRKKEFKRIKSMLQGSNTYFGDEEIYQDSEVRLSQALCNSFQVKAFRIKRDKLIQFLTGKRRMNLFIQDMKIKYDYRQERENFITKNLQKQEKKLKEESQTQQVQSLIKQSVQHYYRNNSQEIEITPKANPSQILAQQYKNQKRASLNRNSSFQLNKSNTDLISAFSLKVGVVKEKSEFEIQKDLEQQQTTSRSSILSQSQFSFKKRKTANNLQQNIQEYQQKLNEQIMPPSTKPMIKQNLIDKSSQQLRAKEKIFEKLKQQHAQYQNSKNNEKSQRQMNNSTSQGKRIPQGNNSLSSIENQTILQHELIPFNYKRAHSHQRFVGLRKNSEKQQSNEGNGIEGKSQKQQGMMNSSSNVYTRSKNFSENQFMSSSSLSLQLFKKHKKRCSMDSQLSNIISEQSRNLNNDDDDDDYDNKLQKNEFRSGSYFFPQPTDTTSIQNKNQQRNSSIQQQIHSQYYISGNTSINNNLVGRGSQPNSMTSIPSPLPLEKSELVTKNKVKKSSIDYSKKNTQKDGGESVISECEHSETSKENSTKVTNNSLGSNTNQQSLKQQQQLHFKTPNSLMMKKQKKLSFQHLQQRTLSSAGKQQSSDNLIQPFPLADNQNYLNQIMQNSSNSKSNQLSIINYQAIGQVLNTQTKENYNSLPNNTNCEESGAMSLSKSRAQSKKSNRSSFQIRTIFHQPNSQISDFMQGQQENIYYKLFDQQLQQPQQTKCYQFPITVQNKKVQKILFSQNSIKK